MAVIGLDAIDPVEGRIGDAGSAAPLHPPHRWMARADQLNASANRISWTSAGIDSSSLIPYPVGRQSTGGMPLLQPARKRGSSVGTVHTTLRREILSLEIKPGTPLDETQLSKRFAMSRSPVREALSRLLMERLVVMLPNRSAIVAPIDLMGFPKFIEALDVQQRLATRLAALHRSDDDIGRLRQLAAAFDDSVQNYDCLEMSKLNCDFHMAVAEAGGNPYVTRHYGELLNEGRRLLHLHFQYLALTDRTHVLNNQHLDIIEAIAAHDAAKADSLAHQHTMQFQRRFLRVLEWIPDSSFSIEPPAEDGHERRAGSA